MLWRLACETALIFMQANPKFQKPVSQLKPIPISSVWDRIGIDLIGPLPISGNGNRYGKLFINIPQYQVVS
jgi:hypothetical protein